MKVLYFCLAMLLSIQTHAVELKDLGLKLDPAKLKSPNLDVKDHAIVGTCDGQTYYSQAELDGCQRVVASRALGTYIGGTPKTGLVPKPVPTKENTP